MPMYLRSCDVIELISCVVSDWVVKSKYDFSPLSLRTVFAVRILDLVRLKEEQRVFKVFSSRQPSPREAIVLFSCTTNFARAFIT